MDPTGMMGGGGYSFQGSSAAETGDTSAHTVQEGLVYNRGLKSDHVLILGVALAALLIFRK